ncbi:unnamed protein product, partial [Gadus morhua 'NCC']
MWGSQPSSTALTKSQAAAEHFPFCTIDPNESRVPIPHERCDFLCQFRGAARTLCAESRAGVADEGRQGLRRSSGRRTKRREEDYGRGGRAGKGPEMLRRLEDFTHCLV